MGSNYQKDLYKQLMEVMAKVDGLEVGQRQNRKEIKRLTSEAVSLRRENAALYEEVLFLKKEMPFLQKNARGWKTKTRSCTMIMSG